jgi:hypothetical protein
MLLWFCFFPVHFCVFTESKDLLFTIETNKKKEYKYICPFLYYFMCLLVLSFQPSSLR